MTVNITLYTLPEKRYTLDLRSGLNLPAWNMCLNEGFGVKKPTRQIRKALGRLSDDQLSLRYPAVEIFSTLKNILGRYAKVPDKNVQLFNGSEHVLGAIAQAGASGRLTTGVGGARARFLVIGPTYSQALNIPANLGNEVLELRVAAPRFDTTINDIERGIHTSNPDVVYICNPNNPTGKTFATYELLPLIRKFPSVLFLIDEAYVEFQGKSVAHSTNDLKNVIVSRTLSKAFGLAGERVGYSISHPDLHGITEPFTNDKDITTRALVTAAICVQNNAYVHRYVEQVAHTQLRTYVELKKHGFEPIADAGNFIAFYVPPERTKAFVGRCEIYGAKIRDLSATQPGLVRVTITTDEAADNFLAVFPLQKKKGDAACRWLDSSSIVEFAAPPASSEIALRKLLVGNLHRSK